MAEKEEDQHGAMSQSPDFRLIEMLWLALKRAVHEQTPEYLNELKQGCSEDWGKNTTRRTQISSVRTRN